MTTEPVSISAIISVLFTLAGTLFAKYGITEEGANEFVALVGTVISAIIVVYSWIKARAKVTPLVRPQNDEGLALVPETKAA
jgi:hypothetical protein